MIGPTLPPRAQAPAAPDSLGQTARDLERAFVREMLQQAGLAEAFAGEGGKITDAFSGFLLDAVADDVTRNGGFGLADRFYQELRADLGAGGRGGR